jgi:hypothetical protein
MDKPPVTESCRYALLRFRAPPSETVGFTPEPPRGRHNCSLLSTPGFVQQDTLTVNPEIMLCLLVESRVIILSIYPAETGLNE